MCKARRLILSNGCSDPPDENIIQQKRDKCPNRKEPIATPTEHQYNAEQATLNYTEFIKQIKSLEPRIVPWYFYVGFSPRNLTTLNKKQVSELSDGEIMDCHPVMKGNNFKKLLTKVLLKPFKQDIIEITKHNQFGSGDPAGGSQLVFGTQLLLEANKQFCPISIDISNAFQCRTLI
mmetsp:Transcript_22035/g.30977  ORF Transcript_22035/g.30977 Transcript_22035/m.30977 type:complete len:177 (-) Transcript_22035:1403-1933(-)